MRAATSEYTNVTVDDSNGITRSDDRKCTDRMAAIREAPTHGGSRSGLKGEPDDSDVYSSLLSESCNVKLAAKVLHDSRDGM